jgi:hypothetical protein
VQALKQAEDELLTARGNVQASRFREPWTPPQLKVNISESAKRLRPNPFLSLSLKKETSDKQNPSLRLDSLKSPTAGFRISPTRFELPIDTQPDCAVSRCGEPSDRAFDFPLESRNPDSFSFGSTTCFKKEFSPSTNP